MDPLDGEGRQSSPIGLTSGRRTEEAHSIDPGQTLPEPACEGLLPGMNAVETDAAQIVEGICIRSGHHCTQPLHRQLGLTASARASLAFTTTPTEIDRFLERLDDAVDLLRAHA